MTVSFDIDGTLIDLKGKPRYEIIDLLRKFQALGCEVFVWSGGGVSYAESVVNRLGLEVDVVAKGSFKADLAVDDQEVTLGLVNLKV